MFCSASSNTSGTGRYPGRINFDVVSGHIIEPSWGATRTEEDGLAHIRRLVASDQKATKWHLILDNLNIHQSESLVRWVAEQEGIAVESLGVKGKSGIRQSMESRAAFLHDPTHQVVLYSTPKHASWMKKARNLAQYSGAQAAQTGQFHRTFRPARSDLGGSLAYYNRTMAKPIKWTYRGLR